MGMKRDKGFIMNKIIEILNLFCSFIREFIAITTGVLIICAVNFSIFNEGDIPKTTLWEILLSSFVTTVVTVIFWKIIDVKKGVAVMVTIGLHYICLCVVMVVFGTKFGWMELNVEGVLMMFLSVAGVYGFSYAVNYILWKRQADAMNQKLKEKYRKEL